MSLSNCASCEHFKDDDCDANPLYRTGWDTCQQNPATGYRLGPLFMPCPNYTAAEKISFTFHLTETQWQYISTAVNGRDSTNARQEFREQLEMQLAAHQEIAP